MSISVEWRRNLDNNETLFLKSSLFRDVAQRRSPVPDVLGTTDRSHLQSSRNPINVFNCPSTPRNIAEEWRSYLHRGEASNREQFFYLTNIICHSAPLYQHAGGQVRFIWQAIRQEVTHDIGKKNDDAVRKHDSSCPCRDPSQGLLNISFLMWRIYPMYHCCQNER